MVRFSVDEVHEKKLTVTCTESSNPFEELPEGEGRLEAECGHIGSFKLKYSKFGNRMVFSGNDWRKFRNQVVAGGTIHIERLSKTKFGFEVQT
ncbi:hypothetical protein GOBAR_AA04176 [Gossypium barbadense]|uniref:TF-B3 domain-containing protein n=1 Tax=Gossypium barbadense TaxID=3634 RepID=A0A2P5YL71_GOSBA|nr:hypothetical protein GOBAR_AA04176 [Gossypium barbadense]